jgi:methylthioribose-1-phosphate isomerase
VATTSTASSSTEGPEPVRDEAPGPALPAPNVPGSIEADRSAHPPPAKPAPAEAPTDLLAGRRQFFRLFGRQAIQTVTQVAGVASAVSQMPTNAAAGLMGLGLGDPRQNAASLTANPRTAAAAPATNQDAAYRSPYRIEGGVLHLLDQRRLPEQVEEQTCRRGSDVAFYLRVSAARGGPLMAQLGAYGVAMTARETAARPAGQRTSEQARVTRAIASARPASRMLTWSLGRMRLVAAALGPDASGEQVAAALWAEADRIASDSQVDHARIAQNVATLLPRPQERPLQVLIHGDPGALTSGIVGTAITGLMLRAAEGGALHAWVTETRPYLEGARLATWELANAGIEHTLLPDSAVAALLGSEPIDAVLLGAEWIAGNGDTANVVGSRAVAELAASAAVGPVPVYVCAPITTYDPSLPDGAAIPRDVRPARELGTYLTGVRTERLRAFNPGADVIPARRITALVTEMGVLTPTDGPGLMAALDDRAARLPDAAAAATTVATPAALSDAG